MPMSQHASPELQLGTPCRQRSAGMNGRRWARLLLPEDTEMDAETRVRLLGPIHWKVLFHVALCIAPFSWDCVGG